MLKPPSFRQARRRNTDFASTAPSAAPPLTYTAGFYDVFGYLGIPMVTAFTLSAIAMVFSAVVQVYPDEIGNLALQTRSLDHGDFLMFSRPSMWMVATSALTLLLFSMGYVSLLVFMFSFRKRSLIGSISRPPRTASLAHRLFVRCLEWCKTRLPFVKRDAAVCHADEQRPNAAPSMRLKRLNSTRKQGMSNLVFEFTSIEGLYHEYYVRVAVVRLH